MSRLTKLEGKTLVVGLVTIALGLGLVPCAYGVERDHPAPLMKQLKGIDTVPTAETLKRAATDIEGALFRVAKDKSIRLYLRRRAASLMSAFPTPKASQYLSSLATDADKTEVRWIAVYTYIRTFGRLTPKPVITLAKTMFKSPLPLIREATAHGLRYVKSTAANALIEKQWRVEKSSLVRSALSKARKNR